MMDYYRGYRFKNRQSYEEWKNDLIENRISRAMYCIDKLLKYKYQKKWFVLLFDILKDGGYATVRLKNGRDVDVEAFAYTCLYASFFDIYASKDDIDYKVNPIRTETLNYLHRFIMFE